MGLLPPQSANLCTRSPPPQMTSRHLLSLMSALMGWLLLNAFAAPAAWGQAPPPATPVERVFQAWLTAMNSGDARQLAAYKATYHRPWAVQAMLDTWARTGGYQVVRVEHCEPLRLTVLLQEKASDALYREQVVVDTTGRQLTPRMTIEAIQRPPELAIPRLSQAAALDSLTSRAGALARADQFAGAVLVAADGRVLFKRAWGESDRGQHRANTPATQFRHGSMTKMFTAVAVLQLVAQGKLSLEGKVGDYLPDYPNQALAQVTVRQLLMHTGGTGDIFGPAFEANRASLRENADYVKLYGTRGPEPAAQGHFAYSNYGFVLLGELISRVSHQSYDAYLRQHIFRPAHMRHTGALPEAVVLPRRATGYMRVNGAWVRNDHTLPYRGMAAGGGYSTLEDLYRFAQALLAGKLLAPPLLVQATTPYFQDAPSGYGYGWGFEVYGAQQLTGFGHEGGAEGMNGELRIFPQLHRVVVVLSNLDPPAAHRLLDYYVLRMPAP